MLRLVQRRRSMQRATSFISLESPGESNGISEFWRKNTSAAEAVELANLLRALRKVAGHLGKNTGRIDYAGMSSSNDSSILLEPEMVMGEYPVPFSKVDYLVGVVTHEALHRIEWSDRVWKLLEPAFKMMSGLDRIRFQKLIHVGEDIYVDHIADQKVFGLYTHKIRKEAFAETRTRLRSGVLSVDILVYLWWVNTWTEEPGIEIDPAYQKPLDVLNRLTTELVQIGRNHKGVTARCRLRADLHLKTWETIEDTISSWKIIDKRLYWYFTSDDKKGKKSGKMAGKRSTRSSMNRGLVQEIETQLVAHSPDLTPIIWSVVGEDDESVVPISRLDFHMPAHPMIDRRLVSRLKAIFQNYAGTTKIVSRGLTGGRIDVRRLYRAPISGRCFQQVDRIPNPDWSVTLLMDASGSMKGSKWRMVENTVANLHRALMGYQNRLQAYAYFESDGICMISRLLKDKQLLSVPPSGQTASGQAIIAAAYLMPKDRKRNILFHVTDGESNFGCDVRYGIEYCRQQNIHLITLGCNYKDREAMSRQYGKTIQFLQHYGQLPQAVERLFKWTFLYGSKPHLQGNLNLNKIAGS